MSDRIEDMKVPEVTEKKRVQVPVENLTESERKGLEDQGVDLSSEFVDVDISGSSTKKVDPKADDRARAVSQLNSIASKVEVEQEQSVVVAESVPDSVDTAEIDAIREENALLKNRLAELDAKRQCQQCGWDREVEVKHEPSEEQISSFLNAVVLGELFSERYTLFGGRVEVHFQTRTERVEEAIREAIRVDIKSGGLVSESDIFATIQTYRYLTSLGQITTHAEGKGPNNLKFQDPDELLQSGKTALEMIQLLREGVSVVPMPMVQATKSAHQQFDAITGYLLSRANDPNFWKAIQTGT